MNNTKKFITIGIAALVLGSALVPNTLRAAPQNVTFNVNSTLDEADANPGNGKCTSTPSKKCTLRAAVMETNALGGTNVINVPAGMYFMNIPGPGEDNAATGDLDIKSNLTIIGAGKTNTELNATALDRWIHVISGKTTLKNLTLRGGLVSNSGGSIFVNNGASVTVIKSVLTGNVASYNGGAIAGFGAITVKSSTIGPMNRDAFGGGGIASIFKLTIIKSTITQNSTGSGGGIGQGGGIFTNGAAVIRESTIDNNYGKLGGGVYAEGGTVEIQNSTIAKNSTATDGGAIYVSMGTVKLSFTTVADNETWQGSNTGGIYNSGGTVNLYHSLLDLNRAGVVSDDCEGSINTTSYNLIFGTTGCTLNANAKNILGISSQLNALASNGGPTQTMSLQMGSAAIDVIPANKCLDASANPLTRDQRNKPRPADGDADNKKKCDLGAYEAQP
jgi:CSLREA domain-containing protein